MVPLGSYLATSVVVTDPDTGARAREGERTVRLGMVLGLRIEGGVNGRFFDGIVEEVTRAGASTWETVRRAPRWRGSVSVQTTPGGRDR